MCFRAQRGPRFIAWQGQTPGRAHKGTASSSVSARPPSHHILQSAGRAGSLSPAPCPAAEPSTFLCARGTTEDLTVPLCSVRRHPLPRVRPPRQGIYSPHTARPAPARRPRLPTARGARPARAPSSSAAAAREGAPSPCPVPAWCPALWLHRAHFSLLNTKSRALNITVYLQTPECTALKMPGCKTSVS